MRDRGASGGPAGGSMKRNSANQQPDRPRSLARSTRPPHSITSRSLQAHTWIGKCYRREPRDEGRQSDRDRPLAVLSRSTAPTESCPSARQTDRHEAVVGVFHKDQSVVLCVWTFLVEFGAEIIVASTVVPALSGRPSLRSRSLTTARICPSNLCF